MGLQFVLGRGNTDKRAIMLEEIATTITNNKQAMIFYLVPDHIQFEAEVSVLKRLADLPPFNEQKIMGAMRLQVFSFSRLAWYFLQDSDLFIKPQLTNAGLAMLIRKLLLEHEEELTIYRGEVRKSGFVQQLTELFLELRSGRINEADVAEIIAKQGDSLKEADFKLKLQDILLLYRGFERNLIGSYIEKEDILTALTKKIETLDLSQTTIYIESYQSFNAQEQELIGALLKKCKDVTIALNLDQGYPVEKPALHELFYATGETYYQLYQLARNGNIPVKQDCIISEKSAEYSEELNQLEDFWLTSSRLLPSNYSEAKELISVNEGIEVWAASDKQAEVTHVAKEIRRLVESGKYRYQDVLVLTRHLNDYRALVNPIFKENDIELFNDQAETMNHHPLVEFVLALLAIKKYNWRYQDIMRLLRTELLIPVSDSELSDDRKIRVAVRQQQVNKFRSQIDIAENVILAYGYEGYHWTSNKPWHYTKFVHEENAGQTTEDQRIEEISNSVRLFLKNLLEPLFKKLDKAKNGLAAAEIVYTFLESSGVSDQIAFWRDQAIESGDLETSKEHEQAWDTFLQLLDEYVEVLGETSFDLDAFYEIIMTGFEQATYSMIPPSIDQVTFSSIESTRIGTTKVTFILGMTEVNLPAKSENASVLTETDRELFSAFLEEGKYLRPSIEAQTANEPYLAYLAYLASTEKLIFSYPVADDSKEGPKLSPYVQRIVAGLAITIQEKVGTVADLAPTASIEEQLGFIGTKRSTLTQLLVLLRQRKENGEEIPPFWLSLYHRIKMDGTKTGALLERLKSSLQHKNVPIQLKPEIVEELYGKDLYTSVSRMENFYSCHFKHYATYGLGLKERDVFELSSAGTGEFFHDALDQLFKSLKERNLQLENLDEASLKNVANDVLEVLYGKPKYLILSTSNRMNYIRFQLGNTIKRVAWALANQSRRSGMTTVETEVLFGQIASQKGIDGLVLPLENQGQLYVRGKIDRVDTMEVAGEQYLSVIDYKSSAHTFDYRDAYYGLAMQMITYLDTALMNSETLIGGKAKPSGAFYLHVKNPFISNDKISDEENYQEELLKPFKLDGILLEDEAMLRQLDKSLEPTKSSIVYPYRELKNESLKSAKFVNESEMNALRSHNQELFTKAGNKIMAGATDLNPYYKDKQRIACGMCPFRSVCEFDVMLPENNYHRVEPIDPKEVLRRMASKEGETE